jgi:tRNA (guanine37-N1)-methyltransferase
MRFDILTIFPELLESPLKEGIIRRARKESAIEVCITNIRDFATDKHEMTDDRPYGGGEGMVMKPEPLASAIRNVRAKSEKSYVVLLSPQGRKYSQKVAEELAVKEHLVMVCGRYEGVDERIRDHFIDEEISLGDYILTGGELAAMIVVDSVTRLLPGVLGSSDSAENDSFSRGGLKYPQYTRPHIFEGYAVPEVLLSGDHGKIAEWRLIESVKITRAKRPDLLENEFLC